MTIPLEKHLSLGEGKAAVEIILSDRHTVKLPGGKLALRLFPDLQFTLSWVTQRNFVCAVAIQ